MYNKATYPQRIINMGWDASEGDFWRYNPPPPHCIVPEYTRRVNCPFLTTWKEIVYSMGPGSERSSEIGKQNSNIFNLAISVRASSRSQREELPCERLHRKRSNRDRLTPVRGRELSLSGLLSVRWSSPLDVCELAMDSLARWRLVTRFSTSDGQYEREGIGGPKSEEKKLV